MIPSKGGCFELTVGGRSCSKPTTGEFPDEDELVEAVGEGARAIESRGTGRGPGP